MKNGFKQVGYTFLLGAISITLGFAQFQIPGLDQLYTDLREIPLLIAVLYLRSPVYLILISMITSSSVLIVPTGHFESMVIFHIVGLVPTWYFYQYLKKKNLSGFYEGGFWILWVIVYYAVLVIPTLLAVDIVLGYRSEPFLESYQNVLSAIVFEGISTALVTTLYIIQIHARRELEETNLHLEDKVKERTQELFHVNEELKALNEQLVSSNKEISQLNNNLEKIVADRTSRINIQLTQLRTYAHANAHEVRGPLASVLGLINLIPQEPDAEKRKQLWDMLQTSAENLDQVICKMNQTLEKNDFMK